MGSRLALFRHQFVYSQKLFWRNPASVFFTVLLPVMFLVIFATIFGNDTLKELGGVKAASYYVPALVTLGVISATTQSLANALVGERESGVLKRLRGTPLPASAFIAGRIGNSIVMAVLSVIVLSLVGRILFGVELPLDSAGQILVVLAVGAAAFCCIGVALAAAIGSVDAAAPVTNAIFLPLYFLSGVFIPESEIPSGVLTAADFFPVRPFFQAFYGAWDPSGSGAVIEWGHLAVVVAWGVVALIVAIRWFDWTPRQSR
jgi:ABC-2 type transport system permease protein